MERNVYLERETRERRGIPENALFCGRGSKGEEVESLLRAKMGAWDSRAIKMYLSDSSGAGLANPDLQGDDHVQPHIVLSGVYNF